MDLVYFQLSLVADSSGLKWKSYISMRQWQLWHIAQTKVWCRKIHKLGNSSKYSAWKQALPDWAGWEARSSLPAKSLLWLLPISPRCFGGSIKRIGCPNILDLKTNSNKDETDLFPCVIGNSQLFEEASSQSKLLYIFLLNIRHGWKEKSPQVSVGGHSHGLKVSLNALQFTVWTPHCRGQDLEKETIKSERSYHQAAQISASKQLLHGLNDRWILSIDLAKFNLYSELSQNLLLD